VPNARILTGDCREMLRTLEAGSVRTCVTSPPYFGLRDYGMDGQIGLEQTPEAFVTELVEVFREVRRVLSDDGTLWLNLGDSYGPEKQLLGVPWRVALALQADGWCLRSDVIWHKPNPMPEAVKDRPTKCHEYLFLLGKSSKYFYDHEAVKEASTYTDNRLNKGRAAYDGKRNGAQGQGQRAFAVVNEKRNKRSVWTITTKPFKGAHFAVMPEALVEPCVLAGSEEGDTVLDPFTGSGTVAVVALRHKRNFVGTELNPQYAEIAANRITDADPFFNEVTVA